MESSTKIYLVLMLMILLRVGVNGQVSTDPVLVDEYDYTPACDDFLGRLDGYLSEMRSHSEWKGFIVITSPPERRHRSLVFKRMMEAWFDHRGFDGERAEIVRIDGEGFQLSFWRIPPSGSKPKMEGPTLAFEISDTVRGPFMLANETALGAQICPPVDDQGVYGEFLRANPSARGNIVVRESTNARARRKAASIVRKLGRKYGIAAKRLRTFPLAVRFPALHDEVIVEYWYLPLNRAR